MDIEKASRNLKSLGASVQHFETAAQAAAYIIENVKNTTVGIGGSKTIDQLNVYDELCKTNRVSWHWKSGATKDVYENARTAQVYLASANAVSETGELVFIDGSGNRVGAIADSNGKKVYIVASVNKICPDVGSAVARARSISPLNLRRFPGRRPCTETGVCVDCRVPERMCRSILILCGKGSKQESLEVIFVDEQLGL